MSHGQDQQANRPRIGRQLAHRRHLSRPTDAQVRQRQYD
ncbi:unnamed protein product [Mycetohabitans rhizoxinica HKI 454]|uniref:Uncharacterized protein n=1 Tax=Mycetohabitans rhizoxinica (strain DSM 19002 / CIP 109453 / HKI 454) TaxID=882378 RepID=E5AQ57_MYCRK|nr:unnamed protein product [Mycetohabitans rhizoxinica HKI 454]